MKAHLEITGRCNLNCIYCYNSCFNKKNSIEKELNYLDWKKNIKEANELKCERFTISGGEPLLNKNLIDILKICKAPIILFTNAVLLNRKKLEELKKIKNLKAFRISLDGLMAHDKYRIHSKHEIIIKKIKLIKQYSNISIGITTQFSKDLIDEIFDFYKLLKDLKIDHWRIDIPFLTPNYKNINQQANFEDIVLCCKKLIKLYLKDKKPFILDMANLYNSELEKSDKFYEISKNDHPCCRTDIVSMRPNGDITVCAAYNLLLSNVREEKSFKKAVKKAKENIFYDLKIKDIKDCNNCRYLKICGTGCRADAFFLTKSKKSLDPVNCSTWPLVEKHLLPLFSSKEKKIIKKLINKNGKKPKQFKNLKSILDFYEKKNINW